jgi:hypothetical protein
MATVPNISTATLNNAKSVWKQVIAQYGMDVTLKSADELTVLQIKAFCKRPKILGLFDRTQQSYDQEKYMVICDADDFPANMDPAKFMRASWDGEDHVFISITKVDLKGVVFGYRILVKG